MSTARAHNAYEMAIDGVGRRTAVPVCEPVHVSVNRICGFVSRYVRRDSG